MLIKNPEILSLSMRRVPKQGCQIWADMRSPRVKDTVRLSEVFKLRSLRLATALALQDTELGQI